MRSHRALWSAAAIMLSVTLVGPAAAQLDLRGLLNRQAESRLSDSYQQTWALVVGIDEYRNLPQDRWLSYAVSDAKAVRAILAADFRFDHVISLFNQEATRDGLMDVLRRQLGQSGRNDGVFVFFAGHGITHSTEDFGDIGYLIPYDGSENHADPRNISMELLKTDIARSIPAKHVFFVMDACYGGLLLQTRGLRRPPAEGGDLQYLREVARQPVRQVLTAGGAGQEVLDEGPDGHSVFTSRLIERLSAAEGYITATELGSWIPRMVMQDAAARGQQPPQRPQFGRLFGEGDFFFIKASLDGPASAAHTGLAVVPDTSRRAIALEVELLRRLTPANGASERSRAGQGVPDSLLVAARGGVPAFSTTHAGALAPGQRSALAVHFQIPPDALVCYRWGLAMSPVQHPLSGGTWDTAWYTVSDTVATATIRLDSLNTIVDRVLR